MWLDSDPFYVFRTLLGVFLTIYFVLWMTTFVWRLAGVLSGDDPRKKLLRTYLQYQLVSIRLRPLAGELFEIAIWLAMLAGLWWLHL